MLKLFSGKKTYLMAAGIVLTAAGSLATGDMDVTQAIIYVLNGLGLGTLRAGVSKVQKAL